MQGSDCLLEAVEQQDLDSVQVLLLQFPPEDLDLNTPGSQGLTPLDIAVMTGNTPVAKLLLRAGGREGPHCEYGSSARSQRGRCGSLGPITHIHVCVCDTGHFTALPLQRGLSFQSSSDACNAGNYS